MPQKAQKGQKEQSDRPVVLLSLSCRMYINVPTIPGQAPGSLDDRTPLRLMGGFPTLLYFAKSLGYAHSS